ncbi:MAG: hypothetical protein LBF95_01940 [Treponema sp.]|nr:hypothetical protein [Treponema sp.]
MKNKLFDWVLVTLAAFAVLAVTGCVTTTATTEGTNDGNFGENIRTPVKDFQTVGLVFTETQLAVTTSGGNEGQIFTYQALLKEAQAIGADAIINVVIDKKVQATMFPSSHITTWYGSALAIKYMDTLTETTSVTVIIGDTTTTTQTTSVYFNDGSGGAGSGNAPAVPASTETQPSVPRIGIRQ